MKFIFYTGTFIERWDYNNPDTVGIGGSETSQIEMSTRLAKRGHTVISYVPLPEGIEPHTYKNVYWKNTDNVDWDEDGIWVIYRAPHDIANFTKKPDQVWLVCQDTWYWSLKEYAPKFDKVIALCPTHKEYLETEFGLTNVVISSNGIKTDLIREIEAEGIPERNSYRLIWTSSPDRGLGYLLKVFKKAKMIVPELELHIFYGFDNIDKMPESVWTKAVKKDVMEGIQQPGVFWHGRRPQKEIYIEFLKSGIWCYLTSFEETSAISCMESQALGAIPITNPKWALRSNVMFGEFIEGNPYSDRLCQARYLGEIIRFATSIELQETIRPTMMAATKAWFNWEHYVNQWEGWLYGFSDMVAILPHSSFQRKYAKGNILNVGCGGDCADFKSVGAINVDISAIDITTGFENKIDYVVDARELSSKFSKEFDTVVLGELLEHMSRVDGIKVINEAKKVIKSDGRIIITVPDDTRVLGDINPATGNEFEMYGEGCSVKHRKIDKQEILGMIKETNLNIETIYELDYSIYTGWGIICF